MTLVRHRFSPEILHASRVALAASLLVGIVYAACVTVLDQVVSARLIASVDTRLVERLGDVQSIGPPISFVDDDDIETTPVYVWSETRTGAKVAATASAPILPASLHLPDGRYATVRLRTGLFRMHAQRVDGRRLIAGQSLASEQHLANLLRNGEALAAPVLLLAMFAGALTIGVRALAPVQRSRKRQLEFTADASHELRTPLSVISAETSVALSSPRTAQQYQEVLGRIDGETGRLRKIVEDLLWLARFDSAPPQPRYEPLDLGTIASACAERFQALAATKRFEIEVITDDSAPAWISAPPEWIDRLTGVLVDNACRYAASCEHGQVRISVRLRGNRVCMTVEDSGPGIAPENQARLFDRFHRSTEQGGSAGLGLAIADSIVKSTSGQWRLDDSDLGGALFEVSWRRVTVRPFGATSSARLNQAPPSPPESSMAYQPPAPDPSAADQDAARSHTPSQPR